MPLRMADPKLARHFVGPSNSDISWFRRARRCSKCHTVFLTAEVNEDFLKELLGAWEASATPNQIAVNAVRRRYPWVCRRETVSEEFASEFLRRTCWWLTHSSGRAVRAPGHAYNMYLDQHHGWALEFGANTFLVGKAIERAARLIDDALGAASRSEHVSISRLEEDIRNAIAGAVARYDGNEYEGSYPITGDDLVFGAQSIDLKDAVNFLFATNGIRAALLGIKNVS